MSARARAAGLLVLTALAGPALFSCRRGEEPSRGNTAGRPAPPKPPASGAASAPAASDPNALREDPVAAARSLALWREHLEKEETERKANYDRRRLAQHRAVVASLRSAKDRYDNAKTAAAVARVESSVRGELDGIRARVEKIDRWGVSSNLVRDYEALSEALSSTYPAARRSELAGAPEAAEARREVEARLKHIDEWLAYAQEAEDE